MASNEIAVAAMFLASNHSSYINGQELVADAARGMAAVGDDPARLYDRVWLVETFWSRSILVVDRAAAVVAAGLPATRIENPSVAEKSTA